MTMYTGGYFFRGHSVDTESEARLGGSICAIHLHSRIDEYRVRSVKLRHAHWLHHRLVRCWMSNVFAALHSALQSSTFLTLSAHKTRLSWIFWDVHATMSQMP